MSDEKDKKFVVTLGEIMLRLNSPGHERLLQTQSLVATFGGSESNVAISLSNFDIPSKFVTAIPKNLVGDACIRFLKSMSVDTSCIIHQGSRLGIYFLETGSGPRPSNVIYDRTNSSISNSKSDDYDWERIFKDASWFHISGITPALSQGAAYLSMAAVKAAKEFGLTVSCDLNYRNKLWKYGKTAPEIMKLIIPYVDVVIANEEDIQKSLGMELDQTIGGVELDREKYNEFAQKVISVYSNVSIVAITLRESFSADHNDFGAMCYIRDENKSYYSKKYSLKDIVDRVGGGDSCGAGIIYGLYKKMDYQSAIEFGVAASVLKHTIPADANRVSVDEVNNLAMGDASGRVQR